MREKMKEEKEDRKDQVQAGSDEKKGLTRRKFLSTAAASGAAAAFVPRRVLYELRARTSSTLPAKTLSPSAMSTGAMQTRVSRAWTPTSRSCGTAWSIPIERRRQASRRRNLIV